MAKPGIAINWVGIYGQAVITKMTARPPHRSSIEGPATGSRGAAAQGGVYGTGGRVFSIDTAYSLTASRSMARRRSLAARTRASPRCRRSAGAEERAGGTRDPAS